MNVSDSRRLEVQPHAHGPWLVRAGRRTLAVPPPVGRALLPLHGAALIRIPARPLSDASEPGAPIGDAAATELVAEWLARSAECAAKRKRGAGTPLMFPLQVTLLPTRLVARLARSLTPLASWPALASMSIVGLGSAFALRPWAVTSASASHIVSPVALTLFGLGAVWHELGHAAALRREGYQPGGIGAGLLLVVPVLFADVSAVGLLPRAGRLRVDLAGLAFQSGAAGLYAVIGTVSQLPPQIAVAVRAAATATLLALVYGLLPLPRSDGSWILRDALAGDGPPTGRAARARRALTVLQFALAGAACVLLPARLVALAAWGCARLGLTLPLAVWHGAVVVLMVLALALWLVRVRRALRAAAAGGRGA